MKGLNPIVEIAPNFVDSTPSSPLFEMRIGKAKLLFCGFDLIGMDLPTIQLKSCICDYFKSVDLIRNIYMIFSSNPLTNNSKSPKILLKDMPEQLRFPYK